jgi:hypothetical protein
MSFGCPNGALQQCCAPDSQATILHTVSPAQRWQQRQRWPPEQQQEPQWQSWRWQTAGTTTVVAAGIALRARPSPPLPLTAERHAMVDLRPPVAGAHDRLPRPGAHRTAASACLHGHVGPLSVCRVATRLTTSAAALPAGHSLTRLEPLGWRGPGPAIAGPLLQHHGAPPTSDFGPGLGGRLRRN